MNSSYYYEYWENIHLCVKLTPAKHFGSQTDVQHFFTHAVFILSFNILVSRNPEFMSFFQTFYWSTTIFNLGVCCYQIRMLGSYCSLSHSFLPFQCASPFPSYCLKSLFHLRSTNFTLIWLTSNLAWKELTSKTIYQCL